MTVKERIMMIKLMEKQEKQPAYMAYLGIQTGFLLKELARKEENHV